MQQFFMARRTIKKQTVNNLNFARAARAAPISMLKYLQTYLSLSASGAGAGAIKRVWIVAVESIIMLFVCHLCRFRFEFIFGLRLSVWLGNQKLFTHCQTAALAAHLS